MSPDRDASVKTFRYLIPLGESGPTERRHGLVDGALPVSCPWIFVSIMFLSAPHMRPNFQNKSLIAAGSSRRESLFRGGTRQNPLSWTSIVLQTS